MKNILAILTITFFTACNNGVKNNTQSSENSETDSSIRNEIIVDENLIDKNEIINQLQGKWVRVDYPFSTYEFKREKVKITEEGIVEPPVFKDFILKNSCSSSGEENDLKADAIYFYMIERKTCDKIEIRNDTLIINGVDEDYSIKFKKED